MLLYVSVSGWLSAYEINLRATGCSPCSFGWRAGWKKLSCLPVYVCFSSQYEFHGLLLLPLSEECTPHSIQYYDSLPFNCFLRGPCSPFLGWTAVFPQMHHEAVRVGFLPEPVAKADRLRAATWMERNLVTNVDADFLQCEPRWKNVLIISSLFIITHHNGSVATLIGAIKVNVSLWALNATHVPNWLTQ